MTSYHRPNANHHTIMRRTMALLLCLSLLMGIVPVGLAAAAHAGLDALEDSATKTFVKIEAATEVINSSDDKTTLPVGVYQMVTADSFYSVADQEYYGLYYNSHKYGIAKDLVKTTYTGDALQSHIDETIWQATEFDTLRDEDKLVGSIYVYALQLALQKVGYSITVDGTYGDSTTSIVKQFQTKYGLTSDGDAGQTTLSTLYALVKSGSSSESGTVTGTSVGSTSSSVTRSVTKYFIKTDSQVQFFTGETSGTGSLISPVVGSVWQLVSNDYYTVGGVDYYGVYYNNTRYNVLRTAVQDCIFTDTGLTTYITNSVWGASTYPILRQSDNLVGDINTYALQLALYRLNYYSSKIDGDYGADTTEAVEKFQRANSLDADGNAGPITLLAIYGLLGSTGGSSSSGSTGTTVTSGTLRTNVKVNLRKSATTSSTRLDVVPAYTTLSFTKTQTVSGIIWYYVVYDNQDGWLMGSYVTASNISTGGSSSSGTSVGTLTTKVSVNLRKSATTSSARLGIVPASRTLSYFATTTISGITWYKVVYDGNEGWLMGTYVSASGSSSSGSTDGSYTVIGTVTITQKGTNVRKTANGSATGTQLGIGVVVDWLEQGVAAGGYTWYKIRTSAGLVGYVRNDCATTSTTVVTPSSDQQFVVMPGGVPIYTANNGTGAVTISAGTVLMMVNTNTFTVGSVEYCSVYYNNTIHYASYDDIKIGIMTDDGVNALIESLLQSALPSSLKEDLNLVGNVYVYTLQRALSKLGYYTSTIDGSYGGATSSAVRNFQRDADITVDGDCGSETWTSLRTEIAANGGFTGSTGGTGGTEVAGFGLVTSIDNKTTWNTINSSGTMFPKGQTAMVMDIETQKVFQIYRWSGGNHADCVPYTTADTKIMCDIVNFPYNTSAPSSSQLELIKADGDETDVNYTWPDFTGKLTDASSIGSAWDRRAAVINVNGVVYPVSIYGFPHGFTGTDSFSSAKFPNGNYFYTQNNYYGMMCVHFKDSTTHSGILHSDHQDNIDKAYEFAVSNWG